MRADFRRNAFDASCRVKTGAGAFMCAATIADVAAFAFLLVVIEKLANFFAGFFIEAYENVPLHIKGVWV